MSAKLVAEGMRNKLKMREDQLLAALNEIDMIQFTGIIPALSCARRLTNTLREIVEYRMVLAAKVKPAQTKHELGNKKKGRSVWTVTSGQARKAGNR